MQYVDRSGILKVIDNGAGRSTMFTEGKLITGVLLNLVVINH